MEPIFGAFIAGTVISASRIAQRQLAALRTLVLSVLAPLFLATAGLRVDITVLARTTARPPGWTSCARPSTPTWTPAATSTSTTPAPG
ncbi:MAG: hypothetical protein ACHP9Z_33040 [Streptosporangiales bacterium]